jgi:hypothetical protein
MEIKLCMYIYTIYIYYWFDYAEEIIYLNNYRVSFDSEIVDELVNDFFKVSYKLREIKIYFR